MIAEYGVRHGTKNEERRNIFIFGSLRSPFGLGGPILSSRQVIVLGIQPLTNDFNLAFIHCFDSFERVSFPSDHNNSSPRLTLPT